MSKSHDRTTKIWYCKAIEEIRACSDPGGDVLSIPQAKALHDELETVIQQAEETDR